MSVWHAKSVDEKSTESISTGESKSMKRIETLGGYPIAYSVIPECCDAVAIFSDDKPRERWTVTINSQFGRINMLTDTDENQHCTLESLRDAGVKQITLHCAHTIDIQETLDELL